MNFNENEYPPRLLDKKVEEYLSVFGIISVEGPKLKNSSVIPIIIYK